MDDQTYSTPIIPGKHPSPVFDYRFHHNLMVTESTIKYLKNNAICFKVYGSPDNEHKPFYETEGVNEEGSTFQNSEESKEIETTGENISQDFTVKDNSSQNIIHENGNKNEDDNSKLKDYGPPPVEEGADYIEGADHTEGINEKFDDMFIYGGQQEAEEEKDDYRGRQYSQSVYEKPKELIPEYEKQAYIEKKPKDDIHLKGRGSSGKKKKKGKRGKKNKDCVIF